MSTIISKEKGRLYLSVDNLVKKTLAATGYELGFVLPRLNKQFGKSMSSQTNMDTTVDTLAFRPKLRALDKFNQELHIILMSN